MTATEDLVDRNARRWAPTPECWRPPAPSLRIAVVACAWTPGSTRESVERVRHSPFLTNTTAVRGFVVDVETGDLAEVLPSQP